MTGPEIAAPARLRPATSADLDAIMRIESSVFITDAWSRTTMERELRGEHGTYLVAVDDTDAVLGYAGLFAPRGSSDADIQTIAVVPAARRAGIARALMEALVREATTRGASAVLLEVRADNAPAQNLYVDLGFTAIGRRAHYYQPDDVDAIVMRLPLGTTPERREVL